jgi:hypothetical protein
MINSVIGESVLNFLECVRTATAVLPAAMSPQEVETPFVPMYGLPALLSTK